MSFLSKPVTWGWYLGLVAVTFIVGALTAQRTGARK